ALVGISCSSSSHCTAVGLASEDSGCNRCGTLAERFNGHHWTLQRHTQTDSLQSVSCPALKLCVAVGGAAAQVWNGRAWKLRRIPAARGDGLTGVSCPTRKLCVAVGTARHGLVLIERWNGSRWPAPGPSGPGGRKADRGLRRLLPVTAIMRARRVLRDPGRFNGRADRALLGRNRPGEQTRVRARLN